MKTIFKLICLLSLLPITSLLATEGPFEIYVKNNTGHSIAIQLYPVGMVLNGKNMYNLVGKGRVHTYLDNEYDYITGTYYVRTPYPPPYNYVPYYRHILPNLANPGFNVDIESGGNNSAIGSFGFGLYKLEIQHLNENGIYYRDSCIIEFDFYDTNTVPGDLQITVNPDNLMKYRFTYNFDDYPIIDIGYSEPKDYKIECWKQNGQNLPQTRPKRYGPSISDPDNAFFTFKTENDPVYNLYDFIPLDSRRDCNNYIPPIGTYSQNQSFPYGYEIFQDDERQGTLTLNLFIQKPVSTPTGTWNVEQTYPAPITILPSVKFRLASKMTLSELPSYMQDFKMTAKSSSKLILDNSFNPDSTKIKVYKKNWLILEYNSEITMNLNPYSNSEIMLVPSGKFCDYGSIKHGKFRLRFINGVHYMFCDAPDYLFDDSTEVLTDTAAVINIPDNTNLIIDGNQSLLNLSYNDTLKFGANSKLIVRNGAHLVADHAKFTSLDPNIPWDGIYLSGISNDTITNCTIENAVNGINITDKNYSFYGVPSTEISNCTFSNTTNTQLTSGVYVNNSTNVLIKGNNFTSSQLAQGVANGVMIEYCPAGSPLVVDNNIDKVLTGIFVSQSSPYIARNTITGVTGSGKGIELDNSNGTVEYNIVNNFVNSYTSSYSSPYLLKNTFNNASETNLDLYVGSIPVIRPVNSGTLLRWLSGNNIISGSPTNAGISLVEESYPVMDSGFNKIMVGTSDYMSGAIPYSLSGELNAKMNYWYDDPPESQRMAVTGGTVLYDPTFDGSSLPPTDYTELNEIGFGLYDTVFVETLGGDNPSPENLFSQAYQNERAHQYLQAITLYKQVVTNYRNSSYASLSLSRIFNCLEKKIGTISEFQLLQTYMNQLRTNNLYPAELREIAEDFIIKAKVKQGMLQYAINDYQTMYEQNQNNHKGIHALINKEILITMLNDTGDAPGGGTNIQKLANHKLKLLSLITGRDFTPLKVTNKNQVPHEYKLYQNYPNPFNPKTTIKYDLPKDGFVSFKVYDILGKELYSVNEYKQAGTYTITLDGSNYASGLYFYRLETGSYVETKKMVLIK